MATTQNRRRTSSINQMKVDPAGVESRNGEKRPQHNTQSRRNLASSLALLLLVGLGNRDAVVLGEDESHLVPSKLSHYCLGTAYMGDIDAGKECFKLLPTPFHDEDDKDNETPLIAFDSSVDLGFVCLEVVQTNAGNMELEVDYQTGEGWAMKEGHIWFGTSVATAPLMLHDSHDNGKAVTHKLPDATRFPFHTDLEEMNDPKMQTTTIWNEVVQVNDLIVCHSNEDDETPEETGIRAFSAQAVLWSPYDNITVTAFAAILPQDSFATLEDYFVVCACPDATVETADEDEGDSTDQQGSFLDEETELQENEEIHAVDSLMHLEDELAEAVEEETKQDETSKREESNDSDDSDTDIDQEKGSSTVSPEEEAGDSTDQQGEFLDDKTELQENEEIHALDSLMHLEDELAEAVEEEGTKQSNDADNDNDQEQDSSIPSDSQDPDDPPTDSHSSIIDSDSKDEKEDTKDDYEERGPGVFVKADELEIATSFIVIMPNQKHYIDMAKDEESLHKTEEQIEVSPELHEAWHAFVEQLMSDHNIPPVNDEQGGEIDHARRREKSGDERRLKPITLEWMEDSPDLFQFLITTPCPTNVLDERHVDMGSSPKALVRGSSAGDGSSSKATCYKAFGKYKVLHLHSDIKEDESSIDDVDIMESEQARQEVCYDIFHMTRQELAKNRLGEELPDDSPFLLHGGKPESCLPTGYSTMVLKPEDIASSLDDKMTTEDHHDSSVRRKKEPLYELRNDDGSWDILSILELVAYLTTSLLMMSLCITIYCCLLPKIELKSRNRVTDDWSHPSLRPQRISSKRSKSKTREPDFFPWLD